MSTWQTTTSTDRRALPSAPPCAKIRFSGASSLTITPSARSGPGLSCKFQQLWEVAFHCLRGVATRRLCRAILTTLTLTKFFTPTRSPCPTLLIELWPFSCSTLWLVTTPLSSRASMLTIPPQTMENSSPSSWSRTCAPTRKCTLTKGKSTSKTRLKGCSRPAPIEKWPRSFSTRWTKTSRASSSHQSFVAFCSVLASKLTTSSSTRCLSSTTRTRVAQLGSPSS